MTRLHRDALGYDNNKKHLKEMYVIEDYYGNVKIKCINPGCKFELRFKKFFSDN